MLESIKKLRKYATQRVPGVCATLNRFADDIEREVSERFMELPLDADGVPIRVDDCLEYIGNGERVKVCGVRAGEICYYDTHGRLCGWTPSTMYRHHHEPTVEDVLREMCLEIDRRCERGSIDYDELFAEYAKKLRLAGDGE